MSNQLSGRTPGQEVSVDFSVEVQRTQSEIVVYVPRIEGDGPVDTGNEHFLVFSANNGDKLAIWTQSTHEGALDQHIMLARSADDGINWAPPVKLVGPGRVGDGHMCSWAFPIVSISGRIYVFWNQYQGIKDTTDHMTGTMSCCYSDDHGYTWSQPADIPMPRSAYDNPDPGVPATWVVWQKPQRDALGRWFVGFTRWMSPSIRPELPEPSWVHWDSHCEIMRFDNIEDNPAPAQLRISYPLLHEGQLRVPDPLDERISVAQEPSFVLLPDGRLFVTMRTITGHIYYSVSDDHGDTWRKPDVLRHTDEGEPLLQPLCCCPIYSLEDGRFMLLYHNNNGYFEDAKPTDTSKNRRPAYLALGEYRPHARQPIWFSQPKFLMDCGKIGLGPQKRIEVGIYTSFTIQNGRRVLWHPDRKFFLLGKYITDEFLNGLSVPD